MASRIYMEPGGTAYIAAVLLEMALFGQRKTGGRKVIRDKYVPQLSRALLEVQTKEESDAPLQYEYRRGSSLPRFTSQPDPGCQSRN
jgi:hypothetical protein